MSTLSIKKNYLTNNRCYQTGAICEKVGIQIHTIGTGQEQHRALLTTESALRCRPASTMSVMQMFPAMGYSSFRKRCVPGGCGLGQ
ncbi:MAG: hypothetical protein ACLR6B_09205 [Blautia sp.]